MGASEVSRRVFGSLGRVSGAVAAAGDAGDAEPHGGDGSRFFIPPANATECQRTIEWDQRSAAEALALKIILSRNLRPAEAKLHESERRQEAGIASFLTGVRDARSWKAALSLPR